MKSVTFFIIMIIAGFLLAGCAAGKNRQGFQEFAYGKDTSLDLSVEKHVKIAQGYLDRNNSEKAYIHLMKAQQKEPGNLNIRSLKGELLIEQRQDELALNEFLAVLEVEPDHAIANQGAGIIYFRAGLYSEAEAHLARAVFGNTSLWKAHNYLGIIYDRRNDLDLAAQAFTAALGIHQGTETAAILNNLGVVHMARKDFDMAADAFRQALQESGGSPRTYNNLGVALAHSGNYGEALEAFRFAGNESVASNNLGFVLLSNGQAAESIPFFEKALELSPSFYIKASENLKRARMAVRFSDPAKKVGSTPNLLPPEPFPSEGQAVGGAAATVKTVAAPSSDVPPVSFSGVKSIQGEAAAGKQGAGEAIQENYGIHVSSWRDIDWARTHCGRLEAKGQTTWINTVELEEKGTWHRVLVGRYSSIDHAIAARPEILRSLDLDHALIYKLQTSEPIEQ